MQIEFGELRTAIHNALRSWNRVDDGNEGLLEELLLVQAILQEEMIEATPTARRLATNRVLRDGIEALGRQSDRDSEILSRRFMDGEIISNVALQMGLSDDQIKRGQKRAITQLTHIIFEQEQRKREVVAQEIEGSLPPATYSALFGVDEAIDTLESQIIQQSLPHVLAIIGLGGIGKTSLADAVVRRVIRHFAFSEIVWLTIHAPIQWQDNYENAAMESLMTQLAQRLLPHVASSITPEQRNIQVRQALKRSPHLIVVDNLEAEEDTAALLALLSDLANPSKFLLTTRTRPGTPSGLFNYPMPELTSHAAGDLIRHYAQQLGSSDLATATDEDTQRIYNLTGGNPLALKLVISLASVLPLPHILRDLVVVETDAVGQLYRRIYHQVWQVLSDNSKALLTIMPLANGNPMTTEDMQTASGLTAQQLWPAITELVNRSLLETKGTTWERRYAIHRLTETFLQTDILGWAGESI